MSKTAFKQVADNAVSTTATSLAATGVTSITLATGDGAKFPAPGNGFWVTIWVGTSGSDPAADANMEKVLCTARSGDVLTIGATTKTHTGGTVQVGLLDVAANTSDMQTAINTIESAVGITSANALEILDLNSVTSAVNFLKGTNSITAAPPILSVGGTDSNTGLIIASKGTGGVLVRPGTDWAGAFQVQDSTGSNIALAVGTATRRVGANISAPTSSLHSGGSFATNLTSVSANTTLDETHANVLVNASGGAKTITLPTASGIAGRHYTIKKTDSSTNAVTVATTSAQTIDGVTTFVIGAQYQPITVISDGSNWQIAMSPLGSNSTITGETPTGTINASNTVFTTARAYIASTLEVFVDGVRQKGGGTDFTETTPGSGTLTFTTAPANGSVIQVNYLYNLNPSSNADTVDGIHANTTAAANQLLALDGNGTYPQSAIQGSTLGYAQTTSAFSTSSTTAVQVTGLTSTVTVPAGGRRVKVTIYCSDLYNSGSSTGTNEFSIWDGTVGSGTQLNTGRASNSLNLATGGNMAMAVVTPGAGSKTYNAGLKTAAGTINAEAAATSPAFILVELI